MNPQMREIRRSCVSKAAASAVVVVVAGMLTASGAAHAYATVVPTPGTDPQVQLGPIAASGSTVVAADQADSAVYVYDRSAGGVAAEPSAQLTSPTPGGFGEAVAISGETIAVGLPAATVGSALNAGVVLLYQEPSYGWNGTIGPTAELIPGSSAYQQMFGREVAIDGSTVVISAGGTFSDGVPHAGDGYVYVRPAAGWHGIQSENALLTPSTGRLEGGFTIAGNTILAADKSAFVFEKPRSGWRGTVHQTARLTAPGSTLSPDVALASNTLFAIGQRNAKGSRLAGNPELYIFSRPKRGWTSGQTAVATIPITHTGQFGDFPRGLVATNTAAAFTTGASTASDTLGGDTFVLQKPKRGWPYSRPRRVVANWASGLTIIGSTLLATYVQQLSAGVPTTAGPTNTIHTFPIGH